jgi:SNF2 family DNA or RNA helicase
MIVSGDGGIRTKDALQQFQHMILSVDNPEMLRDHYILDESLEEKIRLFDFRKEHSKIETLLNLIEEHKGEQIVVWSSHPSVSDHLESILEGEKIKVGKIHGSCLPRGKSPDEFKQDMIERFKSGEFRILLAATQVLTTAVTMTNACIQIFFDRTFDYVEFSQARCRIYRIGQTRPVYSYILIADGTLDVTRDRRIEDKNFFDREFLSKEYVSKELARKMFNPK